MSIPINHKIIYVPLTNDTVYPVFIPVVLNDVDTLKSSGKLSKKDYYNTIEINKNCGFPIAPILAALAPIVIPGIIKGVNKLIKGSGNETEYIEDETEGGYIPTNPNIKTLKQLQALYNKYD